MESLFGANWRTAISGYAEAVLIYVATYLHEGRALPNTKEGWIGFAASLLRAIFAYNSKDKQVTGSSDDK